MAASEQPSDWSDQHDLALLYLALVHGTDLEIDPAEQSAMVEKLGAWLPGAGGAQVNQVLQEVMLTYLSDHSREMVEASMVSLKAQLDRTTRIAVLNDLADLASADGTLVPGEIAFIQQLAQYWEVDRELN